MRLSRWAPLAPALLLFGCTPGSDGDRPIAEPGDGTVLLQLEKMDGVLTEGFQLDVRIEAPDGQRVLSSNWNTLVNDLHPDSSLEEYYGSVIRTPVPAGPFVVTTVMHPGMEDEQEPCVSRGTMPKDGTATVTVKFWPKNGCADLQ